MKSGLLNLSYEVEVEPGEILALPETILNSIGAGRWIITIQPAPSTKKPIRNHQAFLNSYSPEDEGLYDDYQPR